MSDFPAEAVKQIADLEAASAAKDSLIESQRHRINELGGYELEAKNHREMIRLLEGRVSEAEHAAEQARSAASNHAGVAAGLAASQGASDAKVAAAQQLAAALKTLIG